MLCILNALKLNTLLSKCTLLSIWMEFFKFKTINYHTYASNSEPVTPKTIDVAKSIGNGLSFEERIAFPGNIHTIHMKYGIGDFCGTA